MNTRLFVRNLSWSVTENELYDLFGQVGEVVSVKIPTRREDGKPRGFAFVEMTSPEASQTAIQQLNGTVLHNRDLVVDYQEKNRGDSRTASREVAPNAKLFIRNISNSVTEPVLQSLFQEAGMVVSVKIATDRDTGEPKGFGFIEMGSVQEAQQAINSLNSHYLDGKEIIIDFQDPNRAKSRPSFGGGFNRSASGGTSRSHTASYTDRW